jgi:hypothetical protein
VKNSGYGLANKWLFPSGNRYRNPGRCSRIFSRTEGSKQESGHVIAHSLELVVAALGVAWLPLAFPSASAVLAPAAVALSVTVSVPPPVRLASCRFRRRLSRSHVNFGLAIRHGRKRCVRVPATVGTNAIAVPTAPPAAPAVEPVPAGRRTPAASLSNRFFKAFRLEGLDILGDALGHRIP